MACYPAFRYARCHNTRFPQHERVSRYDVRLCLAEDQLPARAEPAQWVHPLGQSAARAGTNRFPSDPRSMRLRDLLNWERFRDAAVCDA